jgi:hypothetical protein
MESPIHGLVLHIEEGAESSANNWFHNPGAQASAHFGNPKVGQLDQWVDTADMAWAEVNGNPHWYSVEHEGIAPCSLTPSQFENDAQLLAWLHVNYNVPLQITDDPNGFGLGWHGMGGLSWGGHYGCPGDPIKNARLALIVRAREILSPPKPKPPAAKGTPTAADLARADLVRLKTPLGARQAIKNGWHLWYWATDRFAAQIGGKPNRVTLYANRNFRKKA